MKKLIFLLFTISFLNGFAQQNVLIMHFRGHKCINCPAGDVILENLKNTYADRVIPVNVHCGYYSVPNSYGTEYTYDFRNDVGNEMGGDGVYDYYGYYSIFAYPTGVANILRPDRVLAPNDWEIEVQNYMNQEPEACISFTSNYNEISRSLNVDIRAISYNSLYDNLRLVAYITEDSIISWQKDADSNPIDVENYVHNYVLRGALNGTWGVEYSSGELLTYNTTLNAGWNASQCSLIVFLLNADNNEVLQVEKQTLENANHSGCLISEEICLVTVDPESGKNMIVWKKDSIQVKDYYKILKEVSSNVFDSIGAVSFGNTGIFIDSASHPEAYSAKYKICPVDTNGIEYFSSSYQKTMNLVLIQGVPESTIVLNWDEYLEENGSFIADKYYIFKGNSPENIILLDSVPANIFSYNDVNSIGANYYSIGVKKPNFCNIASETGDYLMSMSNIAGTEIIGFISHNYSHTSDYYIYPNPATNEFTLCGSRSGKIEIYSIHGKLIKRAEFFGKTMRINLPDYTSGIYYVLIQSDEELFVRKLIVQ